MQPQEFLTKQSILQHSSKRTLQKIQSRIKQYIQLTEKQKSPTDANLIMTCLKNHFVFYNLTEGELENIRDKMLYCEVEEGRVIYEEGMETHCFFVIGKGMVEESANGQFKKFFKLMDGFGEIAMLYKTERNSTVKAVQECQLWVIDRQLFKEAVEEVIIRDFQQNRKCLENLRFFNGLSREHKDLIASSLLTKRFAKNQTIIKQGDPGSCFYYIKDGYASAYKGSKLVKKLMKGDSFGQQSLYYNTMRQLSVKADQQSTLLILPRDTLYKIMGQDIYQVTFKNFLIHSLQNNPFFQSLNLKKPQLDTLVQKMKLSSYKVNQTIFRKGVSGFQKLVVVIEGQLKNTRNGAIVASKGTCYGEDFMRVENKGKIMEDEIVMECYGVLGELVDYRVVEELNLAQAIKKVETGFRRSNFQFQTSPQVKTMRQLKLQKLLYVDQIKMGQFGPVYLVKTDTNTHYALRCLQKKLLQQYQVQQFIQNEAKISQSISHPFICAMGKKFTTVHYVYTLMQYVQGKDFDQVMEEIGLFSSRDCQFYVACILSILQYLNQKYIIVRDIKPENFMVDTSGYLKLITMSVSKKASNNPKQSKTLEKTYTIIGTPHYMAPDIILGKGYNNMVDLWSLGVMMYEFMCGYLPFGDSADNAYEIYEEIMRNQLKFPEFMVDKRAKKIIQQFLSHNPETRLDGSFQNIKSNSWFNQIDWQKLQNKQLSPQLIPMRPPRPLRKDASRPLLQEIKRFESEEIGKMGGVGGSGAAKENLGAEDAWKQFGEYIG